MAVSKRWHISFSATEASCPMNLSISKKLGVFIVSTAVIFMLVLISSLVYIFYNHSKIAQANSILSENEVLKEKIYTLSTEIDSMMIKLKLMEDWEDKIRSDENFKSINKEIREMGVGGIPFTDSTFSSIDEKLNLEYNLLINKFSRLHSKVNFNYESHSKLLDQVDLKEQLYLSTPSIYPAYGRISDPYGWRKHPITGKRSFHYGLDFGNKTGSPVYATADGVVKKITKHKYLGRYILVSHNFGYQTKYGHLNKILVKEGDVVKRGQIIAEMGNSGRSTGSHLHYEVLRYSKHRNPYDYLNKLEDDIILSTK
ncbi:MAG: M23 family metallopeptidase [Candidatus Cloacimonetes bacterium]|nr:M23 family metallopeptidase [Candidatus Cloacimonadota bacterium]MCF7814246.1 M23 family metallopeptidase [Candidatus Cloacimonadota bacterium]MCF7868453.1 M23 family metallopeptidase [Candidatus Cloacimonadota bacterium]MCF7883927.1 M23 family metallopeptidase [Candidatus Cloacimonadota bacterium]